MRNHRHTFIHFPERDETFANKLNKDYQKCSTLRFRPRKVPLDKLARYDCDFVPCQHVLGKAMLKARRKAWKLNVELHGRRKAKYSDVSQDFFHEKPIALTGGGCLSQDFPIF